MSHGHVDQAQFRQLLGRFATGVAVLAIRLPDGRPAGMTVNSLASVSLDPPLVAACIAHGADLHDALAASPGFALSILGEGQEALSRRFSGARTDRFAGVAHRPSPGGHPILDGALAWIECAHYAAVPGGDHTILLGRVVRGEAGDGAPLIFYRGGYTGLRRGS